MTGEMMLFGLILAITLLLALPAQSQQAILAFICTDRDQAEILAGEMTNHSPSPVDERWSSCKPVGKPVGSMAGAPPPFMGPLSDWEGDPFALYTNGIVVFIMFWVNGYSPTENEVDYAKPRYLRR